MESVQLVAGQTIDAGTVSFSDLDTNNDGQDDTMEFCYNTKDGWEIAETHFWVGETRSTLPTNRSGNPVPGSFPYKSGTLAAGTTTYCVRIPMSAINFSCPNTGSKDFLIAAHAALRKVSGGTVVQTETGWTVGERIATKGNWGMFTALTITCDVTLPPPPCVDESETAFAMAPTGAVCFSAVNDLLSAPTSSGCGVEEYDIPNPARWGWTNLIDGTNNVMTLYAGGAQCDTEKGTNVGTATVSVVNGKAKVTIQMASGYNLGGSLGGAAIYIGSDPLHLEIKTSGPNGAISCNSSGYTVAPGQQPIQSGELASGTATWTSPEVTVSGPFYVYVHVNAVQCK